MGLLIFRIVCCILIFCGLIVEKETKLDIIPFLMVEIGTVALASSFGALVLLIVVLIEVKSIRKQLARKV